MRQIGKVGSIILQPVGRNTVPSLALASLLSDEDDLLFVLADDNVIENSKAFVNILQEAISIEAGKFVTFGIIPVRSYTGYGYIKRGQLTGAGFGIGKFVEKPSIELARQNFEILLVHSQPKTQLYFSTTLKCPGYIAKLMRVTGLY